MDVALLIARIGLSVMFAVAAVAKLVDRRGTRATLVEFGLPGRLASPGAIALPALELAIAVLLLPTATARWGGLAAVVALVVFSGAIARSLARGEQVDCNCFGQIHSAPVGRGLIARDLSLAAVAAAVAVAGPGESIGSALAGSSPLAIVAGVILAAALAFQGWFSYQLFRQNGRLIERVRVLEDAVGDAAPQRPPSGLPERSQAPRFELPDLSGRPRSLEELLRGGVPLALAFMDPDCGACAPLLPRLAELREQRTGELEVALVTRGKPHETRERLNGYAFDNVLLQELHEVADAYRVNGVPSAVVIDPGGRIASSTAVGQGAIEQLLTSARGHTVALDSVPATES